jgi:hypothetical protein
MQRNTAATGTALPFRCGTFIAARSHRPSINIRKRPRTFGINCSRDDAQIGGYPPLPLKKNWTPKWGVCPVVGVLLVYKTAVHCETRSC